VAATALAVRVMEAVVPVVVAPVETAAAAVKALAMVEVSMD
jgi:hypothetical protein